MDIDDVMRQFDLLEKKIEQLLEQRNTLEQHNLELTQKAGELEAALEEKAEEENRYSKQKVLIRSKIDNLLEKLNQEPGNQATE
ncbi:MAG: hypothetical protein ACQEQN_05745 [Thermodesulfobacteriota bacterium]